LVWNARSDNSATPQRLFWTRRLSDVHEPRESFNANDRQFHANGCFGAEDSRFGGFQLR
jgi:hypothetical protein